MHIALQPQVIINIILYTSQGPVVFNSNGSRDANVIRIQQYHVAGREGTDSDL